MANKENAAIVAAKNANVTNVIADRAPEIFDNEVSRANKTQIRDYFRKYAPQLRAQWDGLKNEDSAYKTLNAVIAGRAGSAGMTPAEWLVANYSRYITADGRPCNRRKDDNGVYYTACNLSGLTARSILMRAALNCIESQRRGNHWAQEIVTPRAAKK